MRILKFIVATIIMLSWITSYALPKSVMAVLQQLNMQFAHMKVVANYKYRHGIAVLIPVRERVILKAGMRQVKRLGVEPISARAFFLQQLQIAHDIQVSWMNDWRRNRVKPDTTRPTFRSLTEVERSIVKENNTLWQLIVNAMPDLSNPALANEIISQTQQIIQQPFVTGAAKIRLAKSLIKVRMQ